jgi:hypothetical protein
LASVAIGCVGGRGEWCAGMAAKSKSAYFSDEDSTRIQNKKQITKIITNFPISRSCLW